MRHIRAITTRPTRIAWLAMLVAFALAHTASANTCPLSGSCSTTADDGHVVCSSGWDVAMAIPTYTPPPSLNPVDPSARGHDSDASKHQTAVRATISHASSEILAFAPKTSPPA